MTNKAAKEQLQYWINHKDGGYLVVRPKDAKALERAMQSLENEPLLKPDGTLVIQTDLYSRVKCVQLKDGNNSMLFYAAT